MISSPALEALVARDRCKEILECLTPMELLIACLRAQGLHDYDIGERLNLSRVAVTRHMQRAQARIVAQHPELATTLEGRLRIRGLARVKSESDWLSGPPPHGRGTAPSGAPDQPPDPLRPQLGGRADPNKPA